MIKGSGWFHSDPVNTEKDDSNKDCGLPEINIRLRTESVTLGALKGYLRGLLQKALVGAW